MEEKTGDLGWRMRNCKCMLLLLIPVFYFSAFFYMGKRVNQDKYTKMGVFYAAVSLITFIITAMGLVYFPLFLAVILHAVAWMMCILQTLQCRNQYLQYIEWMQDEPSQRSQLVQQKSWRRRNSLGCLWACIPLFGSLATFYIGRRMDSRKLQWFGGLSVLAVIAGYLYLSMLLLTGATVGGLTTAILVILAYCMLCVHPLTVGYYYEDYLDATAQIWEEDIEEFPVMADTGWRAKGSLWQLLTCVPTMGSLGLFLVGILRQSGKTLLGATVLCVFEMACIALPSVLMENTALIQAYPMLEGLAAAISTLWFFAYVLNIFYGTLIRWDTLRLRAWLAEQDED